MKQSRFTAFVSTKKTLYAILAVIFVFLVTLPLYGGGYWITLVGDILKFIVLTIGWMMFSGPTGHMSLATAAFYGVGMYTSAVLSARFPFVVLIILAGVLSFIVALGVGALTLRLRGVYFTIFTFALVQLVLYVVSEVERVVTKTRGRFVETQSGEVVFYAIFIVLLLTIVTALLVKRSRWGLALESIGEHEEAAAHCGIDVTRTKIFAFALTAVFMGMMGAIIATRRAYIDPGIAFDLNNSFWPVLMAMFGGMQHLAGPVIGAAIFTYLGEFLQTRFPELYMLIFGVVLIIAILFLPRGILGLIQNVWRRISGGTRAPA